MTSVTGHKPVKGRSYAEMAAPRQHEEEGEEGEEKDVKYIQFLPIDGSAYPFLVKLRDVKPHTLEKLSNPDLNEHEYLEVIDEIDKIPNYKEFLPQTSGCMFHHHIVKTFVLRYPQ